MATIGSLAVNVVARTEHFKRGMRGVRSEISGLRSAIRPLKFIGGLFGIGSAAILVRKGIASIRGDMKNLGDLSADEAAKVREAAAAIDEMDAATLRLSKSIAISLLPALNLVLKPLADIASGEGLAPVAGQSHSQFSRMYESVLANMSDAEFRRFQSRFIKMQRDPNRDFAGFVQGELGISRFDVDASSFKTAVMRRQDAINREITNRHVVEKLALPAPMREMLGSASLGELSRISAAIANVDIAGNAPTLTRRRSIDSTIRGLSALEQGTAAAFSQEKRSQQQTQMLDLQRKMYQEDKEQTKALQNIDRNLQTFDQGLPSNIS